MLTFHPIQWLHLWNMVIGYTLFGILVTVSNNIKTFIDHGSVLAGFGSFTTFAYPATYVYMLIPTISCMIYSTILAFDPSPKYKTWLPSKTLRFSIIFFAAACFMGALMPALPGGDVMTDGAALDCLWTDYMQWKIQFNDPITYPWVTGMDKACSLLKAADGLCWILSLGWLAQSVLYMRAVQQAKTFVEK
ncbi:hypothetical protein EDC94DRAFT_591710 [Helicostylum pulchrum]|uniref:Uncharacterized protein n=1 Tax=Helicostylum pulchrum TaxID=562976 RepID=A0ABP9XJ62_9FUNG|nr:hypothetical protein EDC94DRAFT_591710 [Helicostylum pulchrum]